MTSDAPPPTDPTRAARKDEHLSLALDQHGDGRAHNEFDDLDFVHHALDGVDADLVDLSVSVPYRAGARHPAGRWRWRTPFYVNGMTGGTERTTRINRQLAISARETGMPMACGSVSVALDDPSTAHGFAVIREENPSGFVMANLGVGRPADDAPRAVELLSADALQVHVNAVQETAMPEGSRDLSSWLASVEGLAAASPVPVIVKEVGFGLSRRTLGRLADIGVGVADVSGRGGTDFLRIEDARRTDGGFGMLTGFGQSALASLLDASAPASSSRPSSTPTLLASGGVRSPYDVVKALAAGAHAVGVAGAFVSVVGPDGDEGGAHRLISLVEDWTERTRAVFALLGAAHRDDLRSTDVILRGRLREFCESRGVDLAALAQRSDTRD
ncbi:type 2 isopentenyl-diphosphate Delta-isomerase [Brevibacterium jeotgali]|uniref:Isopentenyl-diphosphate delta-isomerase n=1 Tax=Brevibacterium jeotgali TaxID=1262550 RepID=A0A2H1L5U2_9MICO|nr:type 2 isopentenyl-diphosphate Delta-isomerase [Brevibacterium jeotgali]TWB98930.1 isopentenyl-diphosphate delta-isomerase [Brevibacterium jeotgali]SMY12239.1 isopentenyl-diphosphate delta-isomerase [Brevibacterium jeotgali]